MLLTGSQPVARITCSLAQGGRAGGTRKQFTSTSTVTAPNLDAPLLSEDAPPDVTFLLLFTFAAVDPLTLEPLISRAGGSRRRFRKAIYINFDGDGCLIHDCLICDCLIHDCLTCDCLKRDCLAYDCIIRDCFICAMRQ